MSGASPAGRRPPRGPLLGELLDGYLACRAAEALMPGPFAITALGGAAHANYPELAFGDGSPDDGLEEVADALGIDVVELRSRAHPKAGNLRRRFNGTVLDERLIEKRTRRFSPASLAASPHHRMLWAVRCLPFCEENWETLVDRCPAPYCEAIQRWRSTSGVERCDRCGASLTTARTDVVPIEDQEPLRLLCGLVHHLPSRVEESLAGHCQTNVARR